MSTKLLARILVGILLVILGGIVVHAPLEVGLSTLFPGESLLFKVWKEGLLGAGLVLVIIVISQRGTWREFLNDRMMQVAAAYAALHIVMLAVFWQGLSASLAGVLIDLRFVLYFVLVYVALRLFPETRRLFVVVLTAGATIVLGFALLQVTVLPVDVLKYIGYGPATIMPYLTVDLNQEYIRINSTLRGPNPLGAYAGSALALVAAYALVYRGRLSWKKLSLLGGLSLGGVVALWVSYSRSALVAGIAMIFVVVATTKFTKISKSIWIATAVCVCVLAGGLFALRGSSFISNVLLHENPSGGSSQKSNGGHVASLSQGGARILQQPLGAGVGSTGSASLLGDNPAVIENQYLFIAHETGWAGLGLFLWLFGIVMHRLWRQRADWLALGMFASGFGLAAIGLLLPVWVDDTVAIVWWGMAAVALASGGQRGKRRSKSTK